MARLTIYKDGYVDSTVVPNRFIDEFMREANDAQLKVYLYLIRMVGANQATSVSDIADKFNHTEKDVLRALRYWEKKGLLSLDYDEDRALAGVHLCDLSGSGEGLPKNGHTPEPAIQPVTPAPAVSGAALPLPQAGCAAVEQAAVRPDIIPVAGNADSAPLSMQEDPAFVKPVYTTEQLREFKDRQDTAQLLFIAESYMSRPLTPAEIKSILFFTDVLHFSDDLIDYLIQYCVDRGKKDFKYIEKVAIRWAEEGVSTPKQAQRCSTKYDKNVYAIMNELGKNGSPTSKELEYITRWTREYGFTTDIIFEACERTVMATDKHRFEYAESILSSWKQANVHRKADICKIDDLYQQKRKNTAKSASTNKFNQFTQNNYNFDELERELEQELLRG